MQDLLVAILMAPQFNYRVDLASRSDSITPLSDDALASRLSYFIWSSMPDDELRALARNKQLHEPDVLAGQLKRMLSDSRSRALAVEFGGHGWTSDDLNNTTVLIASVSPRSLINFASPCSKSQYVSCTISFKPMVACSTAFMRITFGPTQPWRPTMVILRGRMLAMRVGRNLPAKNGRGGLLTMSVFLTQNAPGRRTSPVKRGYWVVRRLLGERIPAPPPDVPDLPTDEAQLGSLTLRRRWPGIASMPVAPAVTIALMPSAWSLRILARLANCAPRTWLATRSIFVLFSLAATRAVASLVCRSICDCIARRTSSTTTAASCCLTRLVEPCYYQMNH